MLMEFVSAEEKLIVLSTQEHLIIRGLKNNEHLNFNGDEESRAYNNFQ